MKRIALILVLAAASILLGGCIVISLQPFYTEEAVVELPQLDGEWSLLRDAGEDVSGKKIKHWVFRGTVVQTYDEHGIGSILRIKYFKIDDTLFMDVTAGEPDESRLNRWWYMHVIPVHSLLRLDMKGEVLILTPLNYDWLEERVESKETSLPFIWLKGDDMMVFSADPGRWMDFLKKHKDSPEAFSKDLSYRLKRIVKPENGEGANLVDPSGEYNRD